VQPPPRTKILLGLGLNFCLRPTKTTHHHDVGFERFTIDCHTRMFFAGDNNPPPPRSQLFIRSNWRPDPTSLSLDFRSRVATFVVHAASLFQQKPAVSNLLLSQRLTLDSIRNDPHLIVMKTDKNLGPAIVDRMTYIRRAIDEHLSDHTTYRQLSASTALNRMKAVRIILSNFISASFQNSPSDKKFLERSLASVKDDFSYFYLLAKVHKTPWRTRPIVSVSGSLLHGLGRWTDCQLQKICRHLPNMLPSSRVLVDRIRNLELPQSTRFFTCDATSMYTNIDTAHALSEIGQYLRQSAICVAERIDPDILLQALSIIMNHNLFIFGDTYWVQLTGTAMGTPPAPMYATLYFAIHEERILKQFQRELLFYGRYIDDGVGAWSPDPAISTAENHRRFQLLQSEFNRFGKLRWTFSALSPSVDFLDLTISLTPSGNIDTCLFEKALNLYLYLPPQSNHPPGTLKGLIYGTVCRIATLTTNPDKCITFTRRLFQRLLMRGYSASFLRPIFAQAVAPKSGRAQQPHTPLFLHVPFHARDKPSKAVQQVFRRFLLEPQHETPLPLMRNRRGNPFKADRLIIAYHRSRNLGNLLAPRRLPDTGAAVSSFL
jgi:hypothetical protein